MFNDFRYAVRMLLKTPVLSGVAVLSLALGLGATSTVFSVVDGIFLRQWRVSKPDLLVRIENSTKDSRSSLISYPDYLEINQGFSSVSGLIAYARHAGFLKIGEQLHLISVEIVSENYFTVLGLNTANGDLSLSRPGHRSAGQIPIAISDALWRSRFGADSTLIGRTIELNSKECMVIGIAPPHFRGMNRVIPTDAWVTIGSWLEREELQRRDRGSFELLARLRDSSRESEARAELAIIAGRLAEAYHATDKGMTFTIVSETDRLRRAIGPSLFLLGCAVFVLMISCANVIGLLLAKSESRRNEIAVRLALGATRSRLVRQLLTESLLLALLGAVVGMFVTLWLLQIHPALMPPSPVPLSFDLHVDRRVLTVTLLVTMLATLLFGGVPALLASRSQVVSILKGDEPRVVSLFCRLSLRNVVVVGQIALSVILLVGTGLLLRSLLFSLQIQPGFDTSKNILLLTVVPLDRHRERESMRQGYNLAMERILAIPGVKNASYARRVPLSAFGGGSSVKVSIPGTDLGPSQDRLAIRFTAVGLSYFRTMGTRIIRGRDLNVGDGYSGKRIVLINETMNRVYWPDQDPIGKRLLIDGSDHEIVAIVEDAKMTGIHETPEPYLYLSFAQSPSTERTLIIETTGDPWRILDTVKQEVHSVDKNLEFLNIITMRQLLRSALWEDRTTTAFIGALAMIGLFLATVGLYGLVSYFVARRTHEIGVRVALGAQQRDVFRLVLGQGLRLTLIGVAVGLASAGALSRLMATMLFQVRATDPATFVAVALLVSLVSLAACYLPARRATRFDPAVALRYE